MSRQVDERVVEMRFDNAQFERNVHTSMSTIDKLKQKLKFKGASDGFENLSKSAKKVDLNTIGDSAEKVGLKFNAMYTMADQAFRNITNSAMMAGKKIVSALTIEPVKTGYSEYTTQLQAVQTIMAAVGHKGKTIDDVNAALDELNEYADQTIYNFTEMTRNIGLFTNAGVGLDESVLAIKGFSNAAAMAGTDATRTAGAMYQLSQAMSSGKVQLMDWRSLEQANITGERFQETVMMVARNHGVAIDDMIAKEGAFRDTLKSGWLTADLMTEALEMYTMSTEGLTDAQVEAQRESLKARGYTEDQIKTIFELGNTATQAATQVRDFSQMWGVLKETAQSGWAATWRLVFGDLYEAKGVFTPLTNFLSNFIDKMSEARNTLLEGALGKSFKKLATKITNITKPITKSVDSVKAAVDSVKDYTAVVDQIIMGDWGNGQSRFDKLTKAGYDWAHAQNLVNEKLGSTVRHATDYKEAQDDVTEAQKDATKETEKLTKAEAKRIEKLASMSEAELKQRGYTDEQIAAFKELKTEADKLGMSISDFVENIDTLDGRTILINSFKNAGQGLVAVFSAMGDAWKKTFGTINADHIYNIIAAIHKFSTKLLVNKDNADNLQRTFKGLFAALDIILTVIGGPIKIVFKVLGQLLGMFNLNVLDVTAGIGDAIVGFRDWLDSVLDFTKIFEALLPYLKTAAEAIRGWVDSVKSTATEIGSNIVEGFQNGISSGAKAVLDAIIDLATRLIEAVKGVLGIQSPSTVMFAIGKFLIAGLILGIVGSKTGLFSKIGELCGGLFDKIKGGIEPIVDWFKNLEFPEIKWEYVLGIATLIGVVASIKKVFDITDKFAEGFEGIGHLADAIANKISPQKSKYEVIANTILKLAIAIGILAASVYALAQLDTGKLWIAIGALGAIAVIIGVLGLAVSKIESNGGDVTKVAFMLIGIGAALYVVASAIQKLSFLNESNWAPILGGLTAMIIGLGAIIFALGKFVKGKTAQNIGQAGVALLMISVTILLMVKVIKQIDELSPGTLAKGLGVIALFGAFVAALILSTKFAGKKIGSAGKTILQIGAAIILMTWAVKLLGSMDKAVLKQGFFAVTAFGAIIAGLILSTKLAGKDIGNVGTVMMGIGVAIGLMAASVRLLGGLEPAALVKGVIAVTALSGIIVGLIAATKLAGNSSAKIGLTLLGMAGAIAILAGVSLVLSTVSVEGLLKGITAVTILGGVMAGLLWAAKGAEKCKGTLIALALAIGVMTAAIAVLANIDTGKLAIATAAIGILMGLFATIVKVAGTAQKAMGAILVMTLAIGAITGCIYLLSGLPTEGVIVSTIALSTFLTCMVGVIAILSAIGASAAKAVMGAIALTALAIPLLAFVGVLAIASNVNIAMENVKALVILAGALTLLLLPLTLVGAFIYPALLGVLALTAMAVPLLAFVGVLAVMSNVPNAIVNANALVAFVQAIAEVLIKLAAVSPLAIVAVTALTMLVGLMATIGLLATAVGALMAKFPSLQTFLDTGIPVLIQIAGGIGEMAGAFAAGIATHVMPLLPQLGAALSAFMVGATPFISGIKMVDASVLVGIGILSAAIIALTAASLIEGIASFLSGGSSFSSLGTELSTFATNAMPFFTAMSGLDPAIFTGVKNLASAILTLTAADLLSGITSFLGGETSFADFGSELAGMGSGIAGFAAALGDLSEDQIAAIDCGARAIKTLAEAAKDIPNEGGWAGKIFGENGLGQFGDQIASVGSSLSSFVTSLGSFGEEQLQTIDYASQAITKMAEAADAIPNEGGLVGKIVGDNSLATFGGDLPGLGTNLASFATNLGTFGADQLTAIDNAAQAIIKMAAAADEIPNEGGWAAAICGDNSLATFADKLPGLGTNLANFATNAGKATKGEVNKATKSLTSIINLLKHAESAGDFDVETFGAKIASFGGKIYDFTTNLSSITTDSLNAAIGKVNTCLAMCASLVGIDTSGMTAFGDALATLATDGIKKFVDTLSSDLSVSSAEEAIQKVVTAATNKIKSSDNTSKFKSAGKSCVSAYSKGITSNLKTAETAGTKLGNAAAEKAKSQSIYSKFQAAGKYCVQGFAAGIRNNLSLVDSAATSLGNRAYNKAKAAIDSNSPSKKFMELGLWSVQGFANGITNNLGDAEKAATGLGNAVLTATQDYLGIHSPSVVFDKEVGRYIVQGIANGISEETAAEKAAKDKAQAIVNAFQKEFDKLDLKNTIAEGELSTWKYLNKNATYDEIFQKELEYLENKASIFESTKKLAEDKWKFGEKQFLAGQISEDDVLTYYKEYVDATNASLAVFDEISELKRTRYDEAINSIATGKSLDQAIYDQWVSENPNATETQKQNRDIEWLETQKKIVEKEQGYRWSLYEQLKNDPMFGPNHEETTKVLAEWINGQTEWNNLNNQINDILKESAEAAKEADKERNDLLYEGWVNTHPNATPEEKYRAERDFTRDELKELNDAWNEAVENYWKIVELHGEGSAEAKKAENVMIKAWSDYYGKNNEYKDLEKDYLEERKAEAESNLKTASEIAKLEYDIWEELNPEASADVIDMHKIEYLTKQLQNENQLLSQAYDDWQKAIGTEEEQAKYKEYLQKKYDAVQLEGEILDLQEAMEKRRTRLIDKQNLAKKEYDDYIKKYKKYYEENGKTLDELEKDAKLVSGYDPSKVVEANDKKTTSAMVTGLTNLGAAAAAGVGTATSAMTSAASTFGTSFVSAISSQSQSWVDAGTTLANAFLDGLTANADKIKETGMTLANATLDAIQESLDSDNRPVITPVVDLSLAEQQLARINAMTSTAQAMGISSNLAGQAKLKEKVESGEIATASTYNYIQNNYSPKALSRTEIFRQTKTLLATKKGA